VKKHNKTRQETMRIKGLSVEVRNGDVNFALRKFKRKIQEAGLMQELRDREFYTKPSEKRKRAKAAGRSRWLKKEATMNTDTSQHGGSQ
jgi:small subunit ribosomal protein S21